MSAVTQGNVIQSNPTHPEAYDSFKIGDDVWCLAWLGMPFQVVGKDNDHKILHLNGTGPCSLPEGARLDVDASQLFMVSHQQWDQIWYWPDSAGETYLAVADRFVANHTDGQIVTGYAAGRLTVEESPHGAAAFRLNLKNYQHFGQIIAEPVAALAANGNELLRVHDASVPSERWLRCGPSLPLEIKMVGYRWALAYGKLVLNWQDFD